MCTKNGLYSAALLSVTRSTLTTVDKTTTTSAVTTTKQLESSEMVEPTPETTNDITMTDYSTTTTRTTNIERTAVQKMSTATTKTTNTPLGRITAQQMSSSEMASGTQAFTLTNRMETVQFVQQMSGFYVNLGMILRVLISGMILSVVFMKTPFKREFKRLMSKGKTPKTTGAPEF